jgi:S1-C subfamily serine protease
MKKLSLCLIALLFLTVPAFAAISNADMNAQIDRSNFLVNRGCSGTLIDAKNKLILTAFHCIRAQYDTVEREKINADGTVTKEEVRVAKPGTVSQLFFKGSAEMQRNSYVYKIERSDARLDLALLKVEADLPYNTAPAIACNDIKRMDVVYAVGNSYAVLYSTVTKGMVSSVTRSYRDLGLIGDLGDATDSGEHGLIQHSAVIAGGNSGGALYDVDGKFVGVNVRGAASGFSFAVPLSDIKDFLAPEKALWSGCNR